MKNTNKKIIPWGLRKFNSLFFSILNGGGRTSPSHSSTIYRIRFWSSCVFSLDFITCILKISFKTQTISMLLDCTCQIFFTRHFIGSEEFSHANNYRNPLNLIWFFLDRHIIDYIASTVLDLICWHLVVF